MKVKTILYNLSKLIINLPRSTRKYILLIFDLFLIILSISITNNLLLFYSEDRSLFISFNSDPAIYLLLVLISLSLYLSTGQYKGITRYISSSILYWFSIRNFFLVSILSLIFLGFNDTSLTQCINYFSILWLSLTISTVLIRIFLRDYLIYSSFKLGSVDIANVAIYGAGSSGTQLSSALKYTGRYNIICFLDDNKDIHGRLINGIKIHDPKKVNLLKNNIDQILLAIPSLPPSRRREIINYLQDNFKYPILQVPSIEDIASGSASIDSLRPVCIEDLLGRDEIFPDSNLISQSVNDKSILITGAGGSIGSELSRQISKLSPKKLVLNDFSENNLYLINEELMSTSKFKDNHINIFSCLGDCSNEKFLENIIKKYNIQTVFHAAAYKHVPIVEKNPLSGIANNIFSTFSICQICKKNNLERMIFISTDKAVRPTNVMGASKRVAEVIVQAFALDQATLYEEKQEDRKTIFSMVRFGNVLGSSGSVIPLFEKQIKKGGPITITDFNINRYFMTIVEASQLVLQSSSLATGGDIFLLDMGEPIKIYDLAKKMIHLSGLKLKDSDNPNGDIEINSIGLRPGEKLFEELLVDGNSARTSHPLIFRAKEKPTKLKDLLPIIKDLKNNLEQQDYNKSLSILAKLVPEWINEINLK